jgi:hypothetical protein
MLKTMDDVSDPGSKAGNGNGNGYHEH